MSDHQARLMAVEPQRSVIVQAPAGSGKTTLLVERYLGLLAVVDAPEEILAITFTRKAAAEMRERVLRYLDPSFHSDAEHEQAAMTKAKAIADKVSRWRLLDNPQRLMIRTIDSFNHFLARSMPVASALGPVPTPADNAQALYRQAARSVLSLVDGDNSLAADLQRLLDWRDHRSQDIENLLANLLGKRDQWLRALTVTGTPQRAALEGVLHTVVSNQLNHAHTVLQSTLQASGLQATELVALLQFAAQTLIMDARESPITLFATHSALPTADAADLPVWRALAEALLTKEKGGQFRKNVSKTIGFPPNCEEKQRFRDVLETLSGHSSLSRALYSARQLPAPEYSNEEWQVLDALVRVLQRGAVELELLFARIGQTDYTGLAAAALRGLGDEDHGITDLGLYLDRRVGHILVDEFQDTNWGQLHLLEKLTAGWELGDGRSLFLVGDPMQSIYRFREAEVGLFIRSRDQGVGPLPLQSSRLERNFRSREEIVGWVNQRLGPVFPRVEDIAAGAVAYAPSVAGRGPGGQVQTLAYANNTQEAQAVARLVGAELAEHANDADYKAAIIVRARSHLRQIIPALAQQGIAYRAVKLDPLSSRAVVQDLLAITKAVLQPADVAALLALLRAPVCGLTLADLHTLSGEGRSPFTEEALLGLDDEPRQRAERVFSALADAQQQWRRRSLRDLVEGIWQRLGGPQCCLNPVIEHKDASVYLDVLERAETNGVLRDWNDFLELLGAEQTESDPVDDNVKLEILTMHGAKGLEWDLVVLPGLNRRLGGVDVTLLHWLPFTSADQQEQVLLAPLRAADQAQNSTLVELIKSEQRARAAFENQRLLYVATTRAKEQLILTACLEYPAEKELEDIKPTAGSLLADLWSTCREDFLTTWSESIAALQPEAENSEQRRDQTLRRVARHWTPSIGSRLSWNPLLVPLEENPEVEFNWAGIHARRTGTVLHRLLEFVGRVGLEHLNPQQRHHLHNKIPQLLRAMGARGDELPAQQAAIEAALEQTLHSETGRWILSAEHQQAACELPVAGIIDGRLVNAVIDRTFVDEQGVRWIVDYKSGYHAGADLETFFSEEAERYKAQLSRYRQLFGQLETRPIKTALYLPRHGQLQLVDT